MIPPEEQWPDHPDFYPREKPLKGYHVSPSGDFVGNESPYPKGNPNISSDIPERIGVSSRSLVQYQSITYTQSKYPSDIAKDALEKLSVIDLEYKRCFDFVEYLDQCEQKGFTIKGYDTKKGKIIGAKLDYNNRWGPVRRKELAEKLERLEYWFELQQDRPVTLVTLTSYQEGKSIAGAWFELNKSRGKLLKLIAKYFNSPDYFWVVEPHQTGYVHYHMAVFADIDNETKDKQGKGIEDKFRDLWSKKYGIGSHTYGLDFAQKKDKDKINHLKNYLQKYLQKGFLLDKWTEGMLKFNANLWETGFRMYGASTSIRKMMNIETEKQNQIVWLETKMECPEKMEDGQNINIDKIIWYRQYIPDWLDSDFWLLCGQIRQEDPQAQYIYDWGRSCSYHAQEYKVISWRDMNIKQRKHEVDPYEEFNKNYHQNKRE